MAQKRNSQLLDSPAVKGFIKLHSSNERYCPFLVYKWAENCLTSQYSERYFTSYAAFHSRWENCISSRVESSAWAKWAPIYSSDLKKITSRKADSTLSDESLATLYSSVFNLDYNDNINKLLIGYLFQLSDLTSMTYEQFLSGIKALTVIHSSFNISDVKTLIAKYKAELLPAKGISKTLYNGIYDFMIKYVPDACSTNKQLTKKRALTLWKLLLPLFPNFKTQVDFLAWIKAQKDITTISRDLWQNLYDFVEYMRDDYEKNFPLQGISIWNSVLDRFVVDFLDLEEVY